MTATSCPEARELQQFLLADLPECEAEAVEQHLLDCPACCTAARKLGGGDTLVEALRSGPTLTEEPEAQMVAVLVERVGIASRSDGESGGSAEEFLNSREPCLAPAQSPGELGRLGPYRILEELGRGGMGVVYRAEDSVLRRAVALKVMRPALAEYPGTRERFLREGQAAAAIVHEHVITIYNVSESRGIPFLAMQLLDGETLEACLTRQHRLPVDEVVRIGWEIAEGLVAAHERGLIHRDVKPANVFLERRPSASAAGTVENQTPATLGSVKLLDFGLACAGEAAPRLTQTGTILGTPGYLAPEQARGTGFDARCDLFSLGCVLYQMCTGEMPFKGTSALSTLLSLALDEPAPVRQINPAVPAPLAGLIQRLLQKDPARRPASARDAASALAAIHEELTTPGARPAAPRRQRRFVVAAGLAAALLAGTAALFALGLIPPSNQGRHSAGATDGQTVDQGAEEDNREAGAGDKAEEKEKTAHAYPVAILAFEERGSGVKDYGAKITSLLNAKLAGKADIFLVERDEIDKTLKEAELNISGAVKANEAIRVGQLTGAKLLVVGSVFQDGKTINVVAKIIGTETTRVRAVAVEGKAGDELGPVVDNLADKVTEVIGKDADKLVAKPATEVDRIAALNQRLKKAVRPMLWISVNERHVGQPRLDPAAQTELMHIAKGAGFTVLDPEEAGKNKADIVITGEGFSELATRRGSLVSVKARVELKAVDRKTDKVIAVDRQTVIVIDLSEQIAGKAALQQAAGILAEQILPKLVTEPGK